MENEHFTGLSNGVVVLEQLTGRSRGTTISLEGSTLDITVGDDRILNVSESRQGETRENRIARLHRAADSYEIEAMDDQSIWVNGDRVVAHRLVNRDLVELGQVGPLTRFLIYRDERPVRRKLAKLLSNSLAIFQNRTNKLEKNPTEPGTAQETSSNLTVEIPPSPAPLPAPVSFILTDSILQVQDSDSPNMDENREALCRQAWSGLKGLFNHFLTHGQGKNLPRLKDIVANCHNAMGANFDDLNVIRFGQYSFFLRQYAVQVEEILMPEDLVEFTALAAETQRFLSHFSEWRDYMNGLSPTYDDAAKTTKAIQAADRVLDRLDASSPEIVSHDAKQALNKLRAEAETADTENGEEKMVADASYLRSVRSVLLAFAKDAMKETRGKAVKSVSTAIFTAGSFTAVYLLELAEIIPAEFSFLSGVVKFISKTVGP